MCYVFQPQSNQIDFNILFRLLNNEVPGLVTSPLPFHCCWVHCHYYFNPLYGGVRCLYIGCSSDLKCVFEFSIGINKF